MSVRVLYQNGSLICRYRTGEQIVVNTPPVASDGAYDVTDDTLVVSAPGLLSLVTDLEKNTVSVELVSQAGQGTVTVNADGSFSYQRANNEAYVTTFTYKAKDAKNAYSNAATITLTVAAIVDPVVPPTATGASYTCAWNQAYTVAAPGVLLGDTGEGTLTAVLYSSPSHGSLTLNSNGAFTYTPTTGYYGSDSWQYRCYNGVAYSDPATISMTVLQVSAATIDAAWLAVRTPPYILSSANTHYTLETDVSTPDGAFVCGADGITLDLNGHTITYNTRTKPALLNPLWDDGEVGEAPPHWDLTHAPGASVVANTVASHGCTQVLKFSGITSAQYVESDPVAITAVPHRVGALAWIKADSSNPTVTVSLINSDTGAVLGSHTAAANRGFARGVKVDLASATNVKIRITCTPDGSNARNFWVGMTTLLFADDHGVMAYPSNWYYPIQCGSGTQAYSSGRYAKNLTLVGPGSIVQGDGAGYWCNAVQFRSNSGTLVMDGVDVTTVGVDSLAVQGTWSYSCNIQNCNFDPSGIPNITDRMYFGHTILWSQNATSPSVNVVISNNTFTNAPAMCINMVNINGLTFYNNTITLATYITEGYGIALGAIHDGEVSYNTVTANTSGRGIFLDGITAFGRATDGLEIHHNTVDVKEIPNSEYGPDGHGLEVTGLRLRNYIDKYHKNISIHDNVFYAHTEAGLVRGAIGSRISEIVNTDDGVPLGIEIYDNEFKAINEADSSYTALGITFDSVAAGTDLYVHDNVFTSNQHCLSFGSNDGGGGWDETLVSNELARSAEGVSVPFSALRIATSAPQGVKIIDTTYSGGATETWTRSGSGTQDIDWGWFIEVQVTDESLTPLGGVTVTLTDKDDNVVLSVLTDETGSTGQQEVIVKNYGGPTTSTITTPYTPHTLNVSKIGYVPHIRNITLSESTIETIAIQSL